MAKSGQSRPAPIFRLARRADRAIGCQCEFSPHQDQALQGVADWLNAMPKANGSAPVFRLFGYAGTGKTTLARHLAEHVDGKVAFAAFTGKAASVMRSKGCGGASTIHSLIYRARESGGGNAELRIVGRCARLQGGADRDRRMLDGRCRAGRDLLSFGVPVLVLGDPAQLPPIQGGGFFTDAKPDAMLTEVHRQAQDDPIVRLSMDVREGRRLEPGTYGESEVVHARRFRSRARA